MRGEQFYYYPETVLQVVSAVSALFSNVIIYRFDNQKHKIKKIKIPVIFGTPSKRQRMDNAEEADKYYTQLPRIEVRFNGLVLSEDRVVSPNTERFWNADNIRFIEESVDEEAIRQFNSLFKDFNPIPYDYSFTIKLLTTNLTDTSQVLENVLPYFAPKNTAVLRVKEFRFLNVERDLIVNLGGVDVDPGTDSLGADDDRLVTSTFNLTIEGFMYRRVVASSLVESVLIKYFAKEYLDAMFSFSADENGDTEMNIVEDGDEYGA